MASEIIMPKAGNSVESCLIIQWKVKEGDTVKNGEVLCEIETDKATMDVSSDADGTILKILAQEGNDVPAFSPIAIIGKAGEDISGLAAELSEKIKTGKADTGKPAGAAPGSAVKLSGNIPLVKGSGRISPRAKNLSSKYGIDPQTVSGSGPEGRIIERDIRRVSDSSPSISAAAVDSGISRGQYGSGIGGRIISRDLNLKRSEKQKSAGNLTGIRKIIAERTWASLQDTAQYTLHTSADAGKILELRQTFKTEERFAEYRNVNIGDMIMFAAAKTLKEVPEINALLTDGNYIKQPEVNPGFAVDTERGLMVPVIRNADKKTLLQISSESKQLAEECISGIINPDSLQGGTFSVTNLGPFGIESFTPVINAPQVAILGVCTIIEKPVSSDGRIRLVPHIGLSMTADHQVLDGAPAARFLRKLCSHIADIETLIRQEL